MSVHAPPVPMVLASIPRCGSTYLLRSVAGLEQSPYTPQGPDVESSDRGTWLGGDRILKTHRPWREAELPDDFRAVFLFGDIVTAVASTRANRYERNHFANCGASWPPERDLYDADILGYEAIWDSWAHAPFPVLCVRYDRLSCGECRSRIEDWLGRRVRWLPWLARTTRQVPPGDRARIERAYAGLIAKVALHRPIFEAGP